LLNSPGPLPLAQSVKKPSAEIPDDELSPLALKRRRERRLRESRSSQNLRFGQSGNKNFEKFTANDLNEVDWEEDEDEDLVVEDEDPVVQAPELNGPEPIPKLIDSDFGIVQHHPVASDHHSVEVSESPSHRLNINLIDSLAGGDYSKYTTLSSSTSNSTSPTASTVVNTAELALFHQRDYVIPQRKHAIDVIRALVEGKVPKENKAT